MIKLIVVFLLASVIVGSMKKQSGQEHKPLRAYWGYALVFALLIGVIMQ